MRKMRGKRGQLTLFIIIAIVIVAILLIVFYPRVKGIFVPSAPSMQLESCIGDKLDEAVELVEKRGGSINPVNAIMYDDEKVEYLCYTNQYYQTCVMQQPLLRQHVEREILDYVNLEVRRCVDGLKQDLRKKGYSVSSGAEFISVNIVPNNIEVKVSGFSVVKGDTGESYDEFVVEKKSELYDLIMLATSILNWEARYGDSDITTYMIYYPNVKVEKYKQEDGSKIYILTSEKDKFVFASRSISWPGGYGYGQTYKPIGV